MGTLQAYCGLEPEYTGTPNRAMEARSSVLGSWKEIAAYLGKGVRTVQRWESELGLPVRRPIAHNKRIVIAMPAELDAWVSRQLPQRHESTPYISELERMHRLLKTMRSETQALVSTAERLMKTAADQVKNNQQQNRRRPTIPR